MKTNFTLLVVTSSDGYIARYPGHSPHEWASREEQEVFFEEVERADWGVMGRRTHEVADKPERRRIVFSTGAPAPEWRRASQVWLDPRDSDPAALCALVAEVRPLAAGVILGGTQVHDWFRARNAIDNVMLTIEPVAFEAGMPIFADQTSGDPEQALADAGFDPISDRVLNRAGTRLIHWRKRGRP